MILQIITVLFFMLIFLLAILGIIAFAVGFEDIPRAYMDWCESKGKQFAEKLKGAK